MHRQGKQAWCSNSALWWYFIPLLIPDFFMSLHQSCVSPAMVGFTQGCKFWCLILIFQCLRDFLPQIKRPQHTEFVAEFCVSSMPLPSQHPIAQGSSWRFFHYRREMFKRAEGTVWSSTATKCLWPHDYSYFLSDFPRRCKICEVEVKFLSLLFLKLSLQKNWPNEEHLPLLGNIPAPLLLKCWCFLISEGQEFSVSGMSLCQHGQLCFPLPSASDVSAGYFSSLLQLIPLSLCL